MLFPLCPFKVDSLAQLGSDLGRHALFCLVKIEINQIPVMMPLTLELISVFYRGYVHLCIEKWPSIAMIALTWDLPRFLYLIIAALQQVYHNNMYLFEYLGGHCLDSVCLCI